VSNVGLHDTAEAVQKRLGKPIRHIALPPDTELGMGELMELHYAGLTFGLNRPKGQPRFTVHRITITSPTWLLSSRVRVGMPVSAVLARLGPGDGIASSETLVYLLSPMDGRLVFVISNGTVVAITIAEEWS
jgi:hypothetical protein